MFVFKIVRTVLFYIINYFAKNSNLYFSFLTQIERICFFEHLFIFVIFHENRLDCFLDPQHQLRVYHSVRIYIESIESLQPHIHCI